MPHQNLSQTNDWTTKRALIEATLTAFLDELGEPHEDAPLEVQEILKVVHSKLFDPELNVEAVRRWCAIGNNNFSSRFRLVIGLGLRDYIELQRMEAAKRLLLHAHLEIYLIAMAVGYMHAETFFRAFQRHKKAYTPQQWREKELTCRRTGPSRELAEVAAP